MKLNSIKLFISSKDLAAEPKSVGILVLQKRFQGFRRYNGLKILQMIGNKLGVQRMRELFRVHSWFASRIGGVDVNVSPREWMRK